MSANQVRPAVIELSDGKPYSPEFEDIYATRSGAYGQACTVFLSEGEVARRWQGKERFTVLENGFGLGTNFLATLKAWRNDPKRSAHLEYVALECFPVSRSQIEQYAAVELADEAKELASHWPVCIPGYHTLTFDGGRVRLILIFGDSQTFANKLSLQYDALFLDGFGPQKNPRMWEAGLLRSLSRYAKEGAVVTTWCTKGDVRRALIGAGFEIEKKKGFGKKRERLFGIMKARRTKHNHRAIEDVIVIGGGLAGANVAYSLRMQGVQVRVVDQAPVPGGAASALSWGILHPHFTRDDSPLSKLSREGFLLARSRLRELEEKTGEPLFEPLGCLQMAHTDEIYAEWQSAASQGQPFALPADYGTLLQKEEASLKAGLSLKRGGWFFPMSGMARCGAFCRALIKASGASYRGNTQVVALKKQDKYWQLIGEFGEVIDEATDVVVCAAFASEALLGSALGLEALPGRITLLRDTDLTELNSPVSGEGYIAHMSDGYCGVGATYELERTGPWTETKAHENNLEKLDSLLTKSVPVVVTGAYCGVRAAGPGRLPVLGASIDEEKWLSVCRSHKEYPQDSSLWDQEGLWVLAGLGSRGLSMSALCADMLTSFMLGVALPADPALLKTLAPSRYLRRQWMSGKIR
jgi:tRNA 5-methylaminomethyl-2-thiouridine biosynthesis bifunctional protein